MEGNERACWKMEVKNGRKCMGVLGNERRNGRKWMGKGKKWWEGRNWGKDCGKEGTNGRIGKVKRQKREWKW
jgi:hypothetical protein